MLSDRNVLSDSSLKGKEAADEDARMHHQEGLKGRALFQ